MTAALDKTALEAFRAVDFDWSTRLQDVWVDPLYDVPKLHSRVRDEFAAKLQQMSRAGRNGDVRSPLGWVIVGPGGSGKTHLLSVLRRQAVQQGAGFVLVDMTDVHNFWETLLQSYLGSLQEPYRDGRFQHQVLVANLIARLGPKNDIAAVMQMLAERKSAKLAEDVDRVLRVLHQRYPRQTGQARDVVRSLICLNSQDWSIFNTAMAWLQGQELDPESCRDLGFQKGRESPREIVRSMSWLMSLCGPTIVAFDQLDPIVHQVGRHRLGDPADASDEQRTAWAIIEQIGGGLAAMVETTCNTLSVVSCVEATWILLNELVLKTYQDRFEPPIRLRKPEDAEIAEAIIRNRLAPAYAQTGFKPDYPTWPFRPAAIQALSNESPRQVLQRCEAHRKACLVAREVSELASFATEANQVDGNVDGDQFARLDRLYEEYQKQTSPDELLDEQHEDDRLAPLLQAALQALVHEHQEQLTGGIDGLVDREFSGGKNSKPLHARLRLVFHNDHSREEHYCVRALQRKNHSAYKTRLKAAMTQSGIDKALKFRRLTIVRVGAPPGGAETQKLTDQFCKAGGTFYEPAEHVLRGLHALSRLLDEKPADLSAWLRQRQPATGLGMRDVLAPAELWKRGEARTAGAGNSAADNGDRRNGNGKGDGESDEAGKRDLQPKIVKGDSRLGDSATHDVAFPLGNRLLGLEKLGDVVSMPLSLLGRHTMILGGSGSGKSVTVRRFVEEAALRGIPSIVIDCARDMSLFDALWPEPPPAWRDGDADLAKQFQATTEMIVWTPGRESGNPLSLAPLPDFRPLVDDAEELEAAVQMVCDGLSEIVAPGKSQKSQNKAGLLTHSLKFFAKHVPEGGLQDYIALLEALPEEAGLRLRQEDKLAAEMADSLKVEIARNPLLRSTGSSLDPAVLFGDDRPDRAKTRISVVNLFGLPSDKMQFAFLNQLAMTLFSWIKKHPNPPGRRPLRGLLVIDEAKDYVPSQKNTECKQSIMRLAAQARKYGLGLVFATQHPKDIDSKIVGNCATHLYGLNNSPASLDTLKDLMQQKGGSGDDIAKLKKGQFYVHNADAGHERPIKVKIPISLSLSPPNPLEEAQILAQAKASREKFEV